MPSACATPAPDDDPPGTRPVPRSHGLRGVPVCGLSPTPPKANSTMLVRPTMTAPAARSRATAVASCAAGAASASSAEPARVTWPATSNRSFTDTGRPSTGERTMPRRRIASDASAMQARRRRHHLREGARPFAGGVRDAFQRRLDEIGARRFFLPPGRLRVALPSSCRVRRLRRRALGAHQLARHAAHVHLVLQVDDRRPRVLPCEPRARRAALAPAPAASAVRCRARCRPASRSRPARRSRAPRAAASSPPRRSAPSRAGRPRLVSPRRTITSR